MGFGGAMLAISAVQGITAIGQGYAQSAEDKYNATLANIQGQQVAIQGQITQGQLTRQGGELTSKATAIAGGEGLEPTGSVAATMLNAQTQIETDKAIAAYNTSMGVFSAQQRAQQLKQQASTDEFSGYSTAFSDLLSGATKAYAYTHKINQT